MTRRITYKPRTVCICCGNTKSEVRRWPGKCIDGLRHIWNAKRITWNVQLLEIRKGL